MNIIYSILSDAHFKPITFEMYNKSINKILISDLPITVDWDKSNPIQNPYKNSQNTPPFHKHFSIFYRGYGINTINSLFIIQKLNLILHDLSLYLSKIILFYLSFFDDKFINTAKTNNVNSSFNSPKPHTNYLLKK